MIAQKTPGSGRRFYNYLRFALMESPTSGQRLQVSRHIPVALFFVILFALAGCSLLEPQPELVIPTPLPTAPPLESFAEGEVIIDPVSDVVPTVDGNIQALLAAVSQQQLMAYVRTLENFGTRNAFSDTQSETFGIGAARRWIFNEFVRVGNGRLQVEFQDFPLTYAGKSAQQSNVVARLPGVGTGNGVIVIMGHYDTRPVDATDGVSRSTGANDNGSGIALLLEAARIMSSRDWNQTIVFLATSAEEQETAGSRYFAENAFLDGMNILGVINLDAVGGRAGIPQHVRMFADQYMQSPNGALARYFDYVGGLYMPTFPVVINDALDREGRYGDHREFVKLGFPAIRIIESQEDPELLNSNLDTWDRIDYTYLQQVTQLNLSVLANLAGAPHQPSPPTVATMAEPGSYLLSWAVAPDAAGYAIAFRPVGSPEYPTFRFVKAERAGNVVLTGLDPSQTYLVSLAALSESGLVSGFSTELPVGPPVAAAAPVEGEPGDQQVGGPEG